MQERSSPLRYVLAAVLLAAASGCVVAPRYHDGYWDHEHDRYWYGGGWHGCDEHREYCR
jgi:hypothetical protein